MIVDKITQLGNARYKIIVEYGPTFVLYKKELKQYDLAEGSTLSLQDWEGIKESILTKRAKKRAMYLLEKMSRSESNLRSKLREGLYPEDVIDKAIDYVKSFGYINDESYTRSYIENRLNRKSSKEIYEGLRAKGIDANTIKELLGEIYSQEVELEAIRYLIAKRRIDISETSKSELSKIFNHLARKGFSYDNIRQAINVHEY